MSSARLTSGSTVIAVALAALWPAFAATPPANSDPTGAAGTSSGPFRIQTSPDGKTTEATNETRTVVWRRAKDGPGAQETPSASPPHGPLRGGPGHRDDFVLIATLPKGSANIWEGDMDHDGLKELWYADDSEAKVWEATANNTFTLVHSAPKPTSYSWFLGIGDTDADGLEEIIWKAGYAGDPYLVFYEQPDPTTFPSAATTEHHTGVENTHYTHLRVFDTDADDVREAICSHQGTSARSVAAYEAFADDTYREIYAGDYGPESAVSGCVGVGDFDGDGFSEIAAPEASEGVRVHVVEAQGNNNYVETWISDWCSDLNGYWATEGGDLDRDGLPDFVFVTGRGGFVEPVVWTAWMFEAVGNDEYEIVWSYEYTSPNAMGFNGGAVTGDATGDGYPELLFQAASERTSVFAAAGDNTLEPIWTHAGVIGEQGRCRLVTSDLDADGQPELVWYTDTATVVYEHVAGSGVCTYAVRPDGSGDFATIQAAIDAASDGDVICLCDGTFTGDGNRNVDFKGKAITVQALSNNPYACVLDCESSGWRGFKFTSGESETSVLRGVTIRNGLSTRGGGIYCDGASPTITNCVMTGNHASGTVANNGGGVHCANGSSPHIIACVITGNLADDNGGGLYCADSSPEVIGCTITANRAAKFGGGVAEDNCDPYVYLENTIVWGNGADGGDGDEIYCNGGGVRYCCCDVNEAGVSQTCPTFKCPPEMPNIDADPLFCNPQPCQNAPTPAGSYYLEPGSPCAADPFCEQLGALGVRCQACCVPPPAPECLETDLYDCIQRGGTPMGTDDSCTGDIQACCLDGGVCEMMEPLCCTGFGGAPQGPGTDCATTVCLEACCLDDGTCMDLPPDECLPDGFPQGAGSQCLGDGDDNGIDDACEGFGACCLPDGSCLDVRPDDCPFGGTPQVTGSHCLGDGDGNGVDDACEGFQACCFPDGTCADLQLYNCWPAGVPQGPYSQCLGDGDGNGIDEVCEPTEQCMDAACEVAEGSRNIYAFMPIGQEFVPTTSPHVGVELRLDDYSPGGPAVSLVVEIHEATINGPVVPGTAVEVTPHQAGWTFFPFDQVIYLEPGATYVIEVSTSTYRWAWYFAGGLCYPYGTGYLNGSPIEGDHLFRTWVACVDCNDNGVPDGQDIAEGTSPDANDNGIPDECDPCPRPGESGQYCTADVYPNNGDGAWDYFDDGDCVVDLSDLGVLLTNYGITAGATREDGDVYPAPDGDGAVNLSDLGLLLSQYGDNCNPVVLTGGL